MGRGVTIKQHDRHDCGAACLASVARYYGIELPLSYFKNVCGTNHIEGTTIKGIIDGALSINLEATAFKTSHQPCFSYEVLSKIPLPSILHFQKSDGWLHFVVLYKVTKRSLTIMDPSEGELKKISYQDLKDLWSGYIVTFSQSSPFSDKTTKDNGLSALFEIAKTHYKEILKILLSSSVYALLGVGTSLLLQFIIDKVIPSGDTRSLTSCAIFMFSFIVISMASGYMKERTLLRTGLKIDCTLIAKLANRTINLPARFFSQMSIGEINSRISDIYRIRNFITTNIVVTTISLVALLCSFILLFYYSSALGLMIAGFLPLYILLFVVAKRVYKRDNKTIIESASSFESSFIKTIESNSIIRHFNCQDLFYEGLMMTYFELCNKLFKGGKNVVHISQITESITRFITFFTILAGTMSLFEGHLTMGELVAFYSISTFFTSPLAVLINSSQSYAEAKIATERVFEIINMDSEEKSDKTIDLPQSAKVLSLENISFAYPGKTEIYKNLSLVIRPHSITAITGRNGCGKSTLASLIIGDYSPTSGKIILDGQPIKSFNIKEWRRYISIVPQDIKLFSSSLISNITLNEGNHSPQEVERVIRICDEVGLSHFIKDLDRGLMYNVGDGGKFLSGGERVKVALARALFRDPKIIILDELTSMIDKESEEKILSFITKYKSAGNTVIIITHDKELLDKADYVVNIE